MHYRNKNKIKQMKQYQKLTKKKQSLINKLNAVVMTNDILNNLFEKPYPVVKKQVGRPRKPRNPVGRPRKEV